MSKREIDYSTIEHELMSAVNNPGRYPEHSMLERGATILCRDYDPNHYPRQVRVYSPPARLGEGVQYNITTNRLNSAWAIP